MLSCLLPYAIWWSWLYSGGIIVPVVVHLTDGSPHLSLALTPAAFALGLMVGLVVLAGNAIAREARGSMGGWPTPRS